MYIVKCSVVKCEEETEKVSICDKCLSLLENKDKYVPLVCWSCGTIIDIFERREDIRTDSFCEGCRECGSEEKEKMTFLVVKD